MVATANMIDAQQQTLDDKGATYSMRYFQPMFVRGALPEQINEAM